MAASLPHATGTHETLEDCQTEVQHLCAQPKNRPVIDQAKGLLIAKHGCTSERAFQMLAEASQRENRKLRDIAKAMVEGAQGRLAVPRDAGERLRAVHATARQPGLPSQRALTAHDLHDAEGDV